MYLGNHEYKAGVVCVPDIRCDVARCGIVSARLNDNWQEIVVMSWSILIISIN